MLSPGTLKFDRATKMPRYAAAGVKHAWLVDPIAQTLEVYERSTERPGHWLLLATHTGAAIVEAPPFDAVPLVLSDLREL